jgi:DNA-binding NarL/FixJ family response regulator
VSDRLRLVLVDDHAVVRDGLRALLSTFDDLEVVGEASSGEEALRVVDSTGVDVVLMDLEMPGMGGIEATRALTARHPKLVVLVLTMYGEDETVMSAVRAGARGYLLKGARRDDVIRTIHGVARGDAIFGAEVAARLLERVRTGVTQVELRDRSAPWTIQSHRRQPRLQHPRQTQRDRPRGRSYPSSASRNGHPLTPLPSMLTPPARPVRSRENPGRVPPRPELPFSFAFLWPRWPRPGTCGFR